MNTRLVLTAYFHRDSGWWMFANQILVWPDAISKDGIIVLSFLFYYLCL